MYMHKYMYMLIIERNNKFLNPKQTTYVHKESHIHVDR